LKRERPRTIAKTPERNAASLPCFRRSRELPMTRVTAIVAELRDRQTREPGEQLSPMAQEALEERPETLHRLAALVASRSMLSRRAAVSASSASFPAAAPTRSVGNVSEP
jgi:hypothetical protein